MLPTTKTIFFFFVKLKHSGTALDNCAIYILSPLGEVVDLGQIGEVFVSGAHVAEGYINGTKMGNTASFIANAAEERKGTKILNMFDAC